ncbi:MAG: hypothetical protein GWN31_00115, partial [Candidatus Thorarchaeota archaeon]|nr:hypothetical protein [Candidatus Thorarchaeota archaeon]
CCLLDGVLFIGRVDNKKGNDMRRAREAWLGLVDGFCDLPIRTQVNTFWHDDVDVNVGESSVTPGRDAPQNE